MNNPLAKHFTFWSLLKFTLPTIIMMVFMSLYTMVDGIFVSRFIGTSALSAVNIVYPIVSLVIAIAIMLATGGSAIISKKMGEGKADEAREDFSLIVLVGVITGIVLMLIGLVWARPIIMALGANEAIYGYCFEYISMLLYFTPLAILQMLFQCFFVTAGKPNLGLAVTVFGGCANIVLDYGFIVPMNMGIAGAALATGIGYSIPAIFGLLYFTFNRKHTLFFVKPKADWKMLLDSCTNGSSEMVTNLSMAVTTFLFNFIMMKYLGEDGVAAITIVLYSQYVLTAIYLGYSTGVAPVFSYNYGNENVTELKKIFKTSMIFIAVSSAATFILAMLFSSDIVTVFAEKGSAVFDIAEHGFYLFSFGYLCVGLNIFSSAMFTAFSNGKVSAIISFLRTFVFILISVILLPQMLGISGIWLAVPFAELLTLAVSLFYMKKLKAQYQYA